MRETFPQANILLHLGRLHKHLVCVLYATEASKLLTNRLFSVAYSVSFQQSNKIGSNTR